MTEKEWPKWEWCFRSQEKEDFFGTCEGQLSWILLKDGCTAMKTEVSPGFIKMEITELELKLLHGNSSVEAKWGWRCLKSTEEWNVGITHLKYVCEGEERNGNSWREMCELDLIFTLIKKASIGMEKEMILEKAIKGSRKSWLCQSSWNRLLILHQCSEKGGRFEQQWNMWCSSQILH